MKHKLFQARGSGYIAYLCLSLYLSILSVATYAQVEQGPENIAPIAIIDGSKEYNLTAGQWIDLDGDLSYDPDQTSYGLLEYKWDAEGGEFINDFLPFITIGFSSPGTYYPTLVVTDGLGLQSEPATVKVNVSPIKVDAGGPYTVKWGYPVVFDPSKSSSSVVRCDWDFGDGWSASTVCGEFNHIYEKPGKYNVSMLGDTNSGATKKVTTTVDVVLGADENFDEEKVGEVPSKWESSDSSFSVATLDGEQVLASDLHYWGATAYYDGLSRIDEADAYEYTGKMKGAEAGISFFGNFPEGSGAYINSYYHISTTGSETEHTYRLRGKHAALDGDLDSGVAPANHDFDWLEFRVQVEETGDRVEIRAKLWPEGEVEPEEWQIDAYDDDKWRLRGRKFGVWGRTGEAFWDDLTLTITGELPEIIQVPDVRKDSIADTVKLFENYGMVIEHVEYDYRNGVPAGQVWDQYPAANEYVSEKTPVKLYVSSGSIEYVEAPSVVGEVLWQAELAILLKDISVSEVVYAHSDTVPEGHVISQAPQAFDWIVVGAEIELTVSLGPKL